MLNIRDDGRFHDFRDYDNEYPKDHDHFRDCKWPKGTLDRYSNIVNTMPNLDTPEYQILSARCKQELIWRLTLQDPRREGFFVGYDFEGFFNQDMNLSYDTVSDTMPEGRLKKTHPVGTVAKVEFIAKHDQPYTGMFRGVKHGIMRISDTTFTTPSITKTVPGFGMKWLRDGMSSANWVAMFSFDGQLSFNFFKNRWVTILREFNNICARNTVGKHLAAVTDHIGGTSVMELS